jgi:hypothetical protein
MFLAAAGERTKRINLGAGVVSLPYHHPFNVAQRRREETFAHERQRGYFTSIGATPM